jgi:5-methylthioadenosine/S-adenosylhomocysteine deaminase
VQAKVKLAGSERVVQAMKRPGIQIIRNVHYRQHDTYFSFADLNEGRLRYREDDFLDNKGNVTTTRARLTLIGAKREDKMAHDVLLSRSRFLAPAVQSLRFYREYFRPATETSITKDRRRWLVNYKDTEFFVNLDEMTEPALGYFLEIKSRTWSRTDADHKTEMVNELINLLGAGDGEIVTEDYIEIVDSA